MSKLTDLRAALGKLVSAEERWESERTRKAALDEAEAWENMHDLLTCDTIASLIAVAEAVDKGKLTAARHALYPLVKGEYEEADCPTCHGHGGGGGFDRNGSHAEGRYCEYPCPTCGKEADDE